jgi:hypothetical protein
MIVLGGSQLVLPAPQVMPITVVPITGAVMIPVAATIPVVIPVAIAVPILIVPAHVIPIAVMIATVIPVCVAVAITVAVAIAAIFGKVAVQVRALLVQASFLTPLVMLVAGKLAALVAALAHPAVALFLPNSIAVAEGAELIRIVVAGLLEPVDALRQLLAVDAVVRPAADDLAESPAEGAAAGLILGRPPQPIEFLAKLRTRTQGAQRPQR